MLNAIATLAVIAKSLMDATLIIEAFTDWECGVMSTLVIPKLSCTIIFSVKC